MTQYGFACRANAAFVTDLAPNTYLLGGTSGDNYPVTRNGITFGWDVDGATFTQGRDRDSGIDVRFAGTVFSVDVATPAPVRIDLPSSGGWTIRVALGDATYARTNLHLSLKDDNTEFATVVGDTSGANQYIDATAVNRTSPADWVSNNVALSHTFTSTILRLVLGNGSTKNAFLVYLLIEPSGGTPSFTFIKPWMIA